MDERDLGIYHHSSPIRYYRGAEEGTKDVGDEHFCYCDTRETQLRYPIPNSN
jgi:hypothetical protein